MDNAEQRLIELESRLAHLENTLEALNDVVTKQSFSQDRLEKLNTSLNNKISELSTALSSMDRTPPPHY